MVGQGSPRTSKQEAIAAVYSAWRARLRCALVFVLLFTTISQVSSTAFGETLRLRLAWGGGRDRLWQGFISISEGSLRKPHLLGVEADEPGSMRLDASDGEATRLTIKQRSARAYDGVDVDVDAPLTAKLRAHLEPPDGDDKPLDVEFALGEVVDESFSKEMDKSGNRFMAMRAPGDSLRVSPSRDALIYAPGESMRCEVRPIMPSIPAGQKVKIKAQLFSAWGGKELWSGNFEAAANGDAVAKVEFPVPNDEGAYDLILAAQGNPNWQQAVRRPLNWNKPIAERRMQFLVMAPQSATRSRGDKEFASIAEIDPTNPRWQESTSKWPQLQQLQQLPLSRLTRLGKGPLGNGNMRTFRHPLGPVAMLNPNQDSPDASWEAYALPIAQPGRPHILEIEYPSDLSQTLSVSILEPNAAGALAPICLSSGIDQNVTALDAASPPRWLKHRLIFWPRTNSPMAMITNLRDRMPAAYGKIRVLSGGDSLPRSVAGHRRGERLVAAYLDRPLFPENFSAAESFDSWSGRSLDDWNTFREGGSRLIEYLQFVGYNGLMINVLADGSAIYPSDLLQSTPRYDTGAFFSTGQDPLRKDVLEMLARMFDREGMRLIPSLEFAAPLPALEELRRRGGPEAQAIEWIGADGKSLTSARGASRGLAPYYNVLNPRVQSAMLDVARELAQRYSQHPSFAGLGVRLSADGYAQLPGPDWGFDDDTIKRFERDAKIRVPGSGDERFAERAAFLAQQPQRRTWLNWRAAQLFAFYSKMREELNAVRSDAKLYLAGAGMLADPYSSQLQPSLLGREPVSEMLLRVGVDARMFKNDDRISFLRPERLALGGDVRGKAEELEFSQLPDGENYFQTIPSLGGLFYHVPKELRVESFDQKSPIKPSYLWLVTQPSPADVKNRRQLAHSLARFDIQSAFDGGWLLPMGQEDSVRDFIAAYRSLPAVPFKEIPGDRQTSQSVVFRTASFAGKTYLYAVNDAPFRVSAKLNVEASRGCRMEELTGARRTPSLRRDEDGDTVMEVDLAPYDLLAIQFGETEVRFASPQASPADGVAEALGDAIGKLSARAASLRSPQPMRVLANSDFEKASDGSEVAPGWSVAAQQGVTIQLDRDRPHGGKQSMQMASSGPIACAASGAFPPPSTGRVAVSVWLRVPDQRSQPPLRVAIEGKLNGRDYYRFAQLGAPADGASDGVPIGEEWRQFVFQVDDLPLEGLSSLRARFDLMGPGDVRIDDVQLYHLAFDRQEIVELSKIVTLADVKRQNGQYGDCARLLESYWPRFLEENVPLSAANSALAKKSPARVESSANGTANANSAASKDSQKTPGVEENKGGLLDRMRNAIPEQWRF